MTYLEAFNELGRKLNVNPANVSAGSDDLFTWHDFDSWINLALQEVWNRHKWIFTEHAYTTDTVANQEYYDYPDDFIADSIYLLRVEDSNGDLETYTKTRYLDYIKYREDYEDGEDEIWADHHRYYFINPEAWDNTAGRTIEIHGRMRASNLTSSTSLLPFSPNSDNEENAGNHCIVELAYAFALESEKKKKPDLAQRIRIRTYALLDDMAKTESEAQVQYQTKDRPLFDVPSIIPGQGVTKEDRWEQE